MIKLKESSLNLQKKAKSLNWYKKFSRIIYFIKKSQPVSLLADSNDDVKLKIKRNVFVVVVILRITAQKKMQGTAYRGTYP